MRSLVLLGCAMVPEGPMSSPISHFPMSTHFVNSICLVCWQIYRGISLGGLLALLLSPCYWCLSTPDC